MVRRRRLSKPVLPSKGLIKLLGVRPVRIDKGPWEQYPALRRRVHYHNHVQLHYNREGFAFVSRIVEGRPTFLGCCVYTVVELKRDLKTALAQKHNREDKKHPLIYRGT